MFSKPLFPKNYRVWRLSSPSNKLRITKTQLWPVPRPDKSVPALRRALQACPLAVTETICPGGNYTRYAYSDAETDAYDSQNYSETYHQGGLWGQNYFGLNADSSVKYQIVTASYTFSGNYPTLDLPYDTDYALDSTHVIRLYSANSSATVTQTTTGTQTVLTPTVTSGAVTGVNVSQPSNGLANFWNTTSNTCKSAFLEGLALSVGIAFIAEAVASAACAGTAGVACPFAIAATFGISSGMLDAIAVSVRSKC